MSDCRFLAAVAVAALVAAASPAAASAPKPAFMPIGAAVEPPYGYFDYCNRLQSSCAEFGRVPTARRDQAATNSHYWDLVFKAEGAAARAEPVKDVRVVADLSPDKWREVAAINQRINNQIQNFSDERQFGRDDYWTEPLARRGRLEGDCEDYVLRKRAELIKAGVPEAALSIAIAKTRRREVHAVLLLATPSGEFVLDNRSAWISPWYDVNYRWERRQIAGSQNWVRIARTGRGWFGFGG